MVQSLMMIRDRELYREVKGFDTFEEYCRVEWDFSRQRAYQLIDSVTVRDNVSTGVDIMKWDMGRNYANKLISSCSVIENVGTTVPVAPTSERQTRPLARLEPEQQRIMQ